jgi:tripartite-type tricarboxylate transporter receptor subunit TctC
MNFKALALGAIGLAVAATAGTAAAQQYPARPVTMVVPFAAGGPTDTVARLIAQVMTEDLGQQVTVENVGGAGGTLGAARVAQAAPDGYTIFLHHIGMATSATLYRQLPYDTLGGFAPIGLVTDVPMTIIAKKDLAPNTLQELVEYLKANAERVTLANAGIGAASHLCGMLLQSALGTTLTTVPYRGTGPAMNDLVGGHVDVMCDQTTNTTPQIQSGAVKAYAVTTPDRVASLPNLPSVVEAGLPSIQVAVWHGLYAPRGTPEAIVNRLSQSLQKALQADSVKSRFAELGTAPVALDRATPAALRSHLEAEIARWRPIIQAAGQFAD